MARNKTVMLQPDVRVCVCVCVYARVRMCVTFTLPSINGGGPASDSLLPVATAAAANATPSALDMGPGGVVVSSCFTELGAGGL